MCISINIRRTNVAFFLCLRLSTSKVPLLVLMLISSCEPGFKERERTKIEKYKDLKYELPKVWKGEVTKVFILPVIGALGTTPISATLRIPSSRQVMGVFNPCCMSFVINTCTSHITVNNCSCSSIKTY